MNFSEHSSQIKAYMYTALWHFLDHQCGAAFFKYPEKLFELVAEAKPRKILEIGTGIGYSTFIMQLAHPEAHIVTVEQEKEHCELARKYLSECPHIEIVEARAEDVLENLNDKSFDVIFYDGYAPRLFFLKQFERLLTPEGLLISANSQKKGYIERDGSTKAQYLQGLSNQEYWSFIEEFADVLVYKKISE